MASHSAGGQRRASRLQVPEHEPEAQKVLQPTRRGMSKAPSAPQLEEEDEEETSEDYCFYCNAEGFLNICDVRGCNSGGGVKVYHAECIGYAPGSTFECPRHRCCLCKRGDDSVEPSSDLELFQCSTCPTAYCAAHKPDESLFKRAMSVSMVEPLADNTFSRTLVPGPQASPAANSATAVQVGAASEAAFVDLPGIAHESRVDAEPCGSTAAESPACTGKAAGIAQAQAGAGAAKKPKVQFASISSGESDGDADDDGSDSAAQSSVPATQGAGNMGGAREPAPAPAPVGAAPGAATGSRRKSERPPLPPGVSRRSSTAAAKPPDADQGLPDASPGAFAGGAGAREGIPALGMGGDMSDGDSAGKRRSKRKRAAVEEEDRGDIAGKEWAGGGILGGGGGGTESDREAVTGGSTGASHSGQLSSQGSSPIAGTGGGGVMVAGSGPGLSTPALPAPIARSAGGDKGQGSAGGGVLSSSATPMTGGALALAAGKARDRRTVDPVLVDRERERAGSNARGYKCIHCAAPSVRVAFARALEAAWVDVVIRILGKREGKEDGALDGMKSVPDAGLEGMMIDTSSLPLHNLGPHVLVQAFLSPLTDPEAAPLYVALGHSRAAMGLPPPAGSAPPLCSLEVTPGRDDLLSAFSSMEPSMAAAVLCCPHESAAVPTRPACLGDVLARMRASIYVRLADVLEDVRYVTRVAGVLAGVLPPSALGLGAGEKDRGDVVTVPQATAGVPFPPWALDSSTGEMDLQVMRAGVLPTHFLPTGGQAIPPIDMMAENSGPVGHGSHMNVHAPPLSVRGPLVGEVAEHFAQAVSGGVAENPRALFYQVSITIADAFARRLLKDRKHSKMLKELESRLAGQSSGVMHLPEGLPALPLPSLTFIETLYLPLPTSSSLAPDPCPPTEVWLPPLLTELGLTDEEALARLRAARMSCTRPELSWTHRLYAWERRSLYEWLISLRAFSPAGGSKRPAEALKPAMEKKRKPIMYAPGKDPMRFNTANLEDFMDTADPAQSGIPPLRVPAWRASPSIGKGGWGLNASITERLLSVWNDRFDDLMSPLHHSHRGELGIEPESVIRVETGPPQFEGEECQTSVVGLAYDQAVAEFAAIEVSRSVRREHRRRAEAAYAISSNAGAGGGGAAAVLSSSPQGQGVHNGHAGWHPLTDSELSLSEASVHWARMCYLKTTRLTDPSVSPLKSPRGGGRSGGEEGSGLSKLFATGLSGAAIGSGSSGVGGTYGGRGHSLAGLGSLSGLSQPHFGQSEATGPLGVQMSQAMVLAFERLAELGRTGHGGGAGLGTGEGMASGVVVVGGSASCDPHGVGGSPSLPSAMSIDGEHHVVAKEAAAKADLAVAAVQALAAQSEAHARSLTALRTQLGDLAGSLGTLVASQVHSQAALASSVHHVSAAVEQLHTLFLRREEAGKDRLPRPSIPLPEAGMRPFPATLRTSLAALTGNEKQAGLVLTELASMDLDYETAHGGTPGLGDLLAPAPEEVAGMFDTLSTALRRGLMAAGELRAAWAASKRALLSVPARVDVERRLEVRCGLDSDEGAVRWAQAAGQEARLQRPAVAEGLEGEEDWGEEAIITLGEGRVAAEYHVANANLRAHVHKMALQLAAAHAAQQAGARPFPG